MVKGISSEMHQPCGCSSKSGMGVPAPFSFHACQQHGGQKVNKPTVHLKVVK